MPLRNAPESGDRHSPSGNETCASVYDSGQIGLDGRLRNPPRWTPRTIEDCYLRHGAASDGDETRANPR